MKLLLTSSGVSNDSIKAALVELLGKPIEESSALLVPTAILPFEMGPTMAARLVRGDVNLPMTELGWSSLGVLELSALPSINRDVWVPTVEAADALLVWGGDPLFLSYWLRESGLTDLLPSLDSVYLGVSAGAMATGTVFAETYDGPPGGRCTPIASQDVVFATPDGPVNRTLLTANGAGLVDVAVIPHLDNPRHPDATSENAARWAAVLPVPTYAIDEQTALVVVDGKVDVVSEGRWELFPAP